jgi:hypothetical protein
MFEPLGKNDSPSLKMIIITPTEKKKLWSIEQEKQNPLGRRDFLRPLKVKSPQKVSRQELPSDP